MRLHRRDLLLGVAGTSLAACAPRTGFNPKFAKTGLYNEINTRCIEPARDIAPTSLAELALIVKSAEQAQVRVRAVGAGHSFSDAMFTDGWAIRMLTLGDEITIPQGRIKSKHAHLTLVNVEGGMRVRELNKRLDERKLALSSMGGWDEQTVAGVVSTSTHGSSLDHGPYPSIVHSIVLVTSGGRVLQIERSDGVTDPHSFGGVVCLPKGQTHVGELIQDDDTFLAALVSFGSVGIIYSVMIEVGPAFWLHEQRELSTWERVIQQNGFLDHLIKTGKPPPDKEGVIAEYYELLLNPYSHDGGHACAITRRSRIPARRDRSINCHHRPLLSTLGTELQFAVPTMIPDIIGGHPENAGKSLNTPIKVVSDSCYEDPSFHVFNSGRVNELRAYSVEIAVETWQAISAIQHVLDVAREKLAIRSGVHSAPISIRFVKGCDAYLSPQNNRPTCMIEIFAISGVLGTDGLLLSHEIELMDLYKARPHWGLDLRAIESFDRVRQLYSATADKWLAQYKTLNASGVFNGEITDRLHISMPTNTATKRSYECKPIGS